MATRETAFSKLPIFKGVTDYAHFSCGLMHSCSFQLPCLPLPLPCPSTGVMHPLVCDDSYKPVPGCVR